MVVIDSGRGLGKVSKRMLAFYEYVVKSLRISHRYTPVVICCCKVLTAIRTPVMVIAIM